MSTKSQSLLQKVRYETAMQSAMEEANRHAAKLAQKEEAESDVESEPVMMQASPTEYVVKFSNPTSSVDPLLGDFRANKPWKKTAVSPAVSADSDEDSIIEEPQPKKDPVNVLYDSLEEEIKKTGSSSSKRGSDKSDDDEDSICQPYGHVLDQFKEETDEELDVAARPAAFTNRTRPFKRSPNTPKKPKAVPQFRTMPMSWAVVDLEDDDAEEADIPEAKKLEENPVDTPAVEEKEPEHVEEPLAEEPKPAEEELVVEGQQPAKEEAGQATKEQVSHSIPSVVMVDLENEAAEEAEEEYKPVVIVPEHGDSLVDSDDDQVDYTIPEMVMLGGNRVPSLRVSALTSVGLAAIDEPEHDDDDRHNFTDLTETEAEGAETAAEDSKNKRKKKKKKTEGEKRRSRIRRMARRAAKKASFDIEKVEC